MRRRPSRPSRRDMEIRLQRQQAAEQLAIQQDPRFSQEMDEPWREIPMQQQRYQEEMMRRRFSIPHIGATKGLSKMGSNILLAFQRYGAKKRAGEFTPGMNARIQVNRFHSAPPIMKKANFQRANILANTTTQPQPFYKGQINNSKKKRLKLKWL